jgi:[acyl-carrier-protein] S-malonyltransferase
VVIAGTAAGVAAAGEAAKALGAKRVLPLVVGGAFHSPLMAPAQVRLDQALTTAAFATAHTEIVANVDAAVHRDGWMDLLSAQLVSPVRWRESLLTLAGLGVTHFLELGPGTELSGMVKRTVEDSWRANVATPGDLAGLSGFVAGAG